MSLWKSKEVLAQATGAASHGNCNSVIKNHPHMRFLIGLIVESSVFLSQPGRESEVKEFKDLFAASSTIMGRGIPINRYKNRAQRNWNTTNIVDLSNDIYDLDEKKLAAMEERARFLDIEEENNDKL